jgi:hypothetical protein
MKKEVTLYIHRCPECGWEAVRGEKQDVNFCSSCGYKGPPVVDTKVQEFDFPYITETYEEDLERYRKSAEYLERLKAGEDPEDLDEALYETDLIKMYESLIPMMCIRGQDVSYGGSISMVSRGSLEFCIAKHSKLKRNEESY